MLGRKHNKRGPHFILEAGVGFFAFLFLLIQPVGAANIFEGDAETFDSNPLGGQFQGFVGSKGANFTEPKDPRAIAGRVINSMLALLGTATIVFFIYGGYLIMTSAGEEDKMKKGRSIIVNSAIAGALILSAYSIARLIVSVLDDTPPTICEGSYSDYGEDAYFENEFLKAGCDIPDDVNVLEDL